MSVPLHFFLSVSCVLYFSLVYDFLIEYMPNMILLAAEQLRPYAYEITSVNVRKLHLPPCHYVC